MYKCKTSKMKSKCLSLKICENFPLLTKLSFLFNIWNKCFLDIIWFFPITKEIKKIFKLCMLWKPFSKYILYVRRLKLKKISSFCIGFEKIIISHSRKVFNYNNLFSSEMILKINFVITTSIDSMLLCHTNKLQK